MRFNPFAEPLDLGPLRQLCEAMGLPSPSGLDLFDPPGPIVYGHLRFEEGGGSLLGLEVAKITIRTCQVNLGAPTLSFYSHSGKLRPLGQVIVRTPIVVPREYSC